MGKKMLGLIIVIVTVGGWMTWSSGEAKREIKLQREAMTKAKSFRTKVTANNGQLYQSYEGEVICPDKLHFTLHSSGVGPIVEGTEYIKFGSISYMKAPQGDWKFADPWISIPDPCENATNDPSGKSAASDALEDRADGSKGDWRSVNGDTCRQWNYKIKMPGKDMEYEECIGADHLPREFKSLDGKYVAYYSDFGMPFLIEKPTVNVIPAYARQQYEAPNVRRYEPPPRPKPSPDPEIPN